MSYVFGKFFKIANFCYRSLFISTKVTFAAAPSREEVSHNDYGLIGSLLAVISVLRFLYLLSDSYTIVNSGDQVRIVIKE